MSKAVRLDATPLEPAAPVARPTPYFDLDLAAVRQAYEGFTEAFPDVAPFYAMKCNSDPSLLATLAACGSGFELASVHELWMLQALDIDPARLVYGSAVKPAKHIKPMAEHGVRRFAFDSFEEVEKIAVCAPGASVYLRCIVDDRDSVFRMSNKFGAEPCDAVALATAAADRGLDFEGLSFNVGSQSRSAQAWERAIERVGAAFGPLAAAGLPVRLLNIGGGYPVASPNEAAPSLAEIASVVSAQLARLPYLPAKLIAEPGRAIAANAATLTTSIVARVRRGPTNWLFLDAGAYNALFEALACQGSTRYWIEPEDAISGPRSVFNIAGPTGDGLDVIAQAVELPAAISSDDRLLIKGTGAYTFAVASPFNGFPVPPVHAADGWAPSGV